MSHDALAHVEVEGSVNLSGVEHNHPMDMDPQEVSSQHFQHGHANQQAAGAGAPEGLAPPVAAFQQMTIGQAPAQFCMQDKYGNIFTFPSREELRAHIASLPNASKSDKKTCLFW